MMSPVDAVGLSDIAVSVPRRHPIDPAERLLPATVVAVGRRRTGHRAGPPRPRRRHPGRRRGDRRAPTPTACAGPSWPPSCCCRIAVTCAALAQRAWAPSGDRAIQVLRISDVGTSHTPLTGSWSRFGWDHPGPIVFWVLAPFARLLGDRGVPARRRRRQRRCARRRRSSPPVDGGGWPLVGVVTLGVDRARGRRRHRLRDRSVESVGRPAALPRLRRWRRGACSRVSTGGWRSWSSPARTPCRPTSATPHPSCWSALVALAVGIVRLVRHSHDGWRRSVVIAGIAAVALWLAASPAAAVRPAPATSAPSSTSPATPPRPPPAGLERGACSAPSSGSPAPGSTAVTSAIFGVRNVVGRSGAAAAGPDDWARRRRLAPRLGERRRAGRRGWVDRVRQPDHDGPGQRSGRGALRRAVVGG